MGLHKAHIRGFKMNQIAKFSTLTKKTSQLVNKNALLMTISDISTEEI